MYKINYDRETGDVSSISVDNTSFLPNIGDRYFRRFLEWNAKQEMPLDYTTPIQVEKPAPAPSQDEKIAALESMVKRLSGDTKQTTEEIDLMVKTGLITEDTAATMKAEA